LLSLWQVRMALLVIAFAVPAGLARGDLPNPLNDLLALGQAGGQTPPAGPVQNNPEPPSVAVPRAACGPGSHPLDGVQGRVPAAALQSPAGANGYWCNLSLVAHQGKSGGFKVLRYVGTHGHECAFYDTALLYPLNAVQLASSGDGVAVIDMSDPAHPVPRPGASRGLTSVRWGLVSSARGCRARRACAARDPAPVRIGACRRRRHSEPALHAARRSCRNAAACGAPEGPARRISPGRQCDVVRRRKRLDARSGQGQARRRH
jgi:hypothetical protein